MTQLLEKAWEQVKNLPDTKQDAIAQRILEELTDDQKWETAFAQSQDALSRIAAKVREDIRAGRTRPVGIDNL